MRSSVNKTVPYLGQTMAMLVMFLALVTPWSSFFVLGISEGLLQVTLLVLFLVIYFGWRSRYARLFMPLLSVIYLVFSVKTNFYGQLPWWTRTWWLDYGRILVSHIKQLPMLLDALYEPVFQLSGFLLVCSGVAAAFLTCVYEREKTVVIWVVGFLSFFLLEILIHGTTFWGVAGYFISAVYLWASQRGRRLATAFPEISAANEHHQNAWFALMWKGMVLAVCLALLIRDTTPQLTVFNPLYDQVITKLEPYLPASIMNGEDGDWRTGRLGGYNRLDQTVVMRVASPRPLYWRREAMTLYDGERWGSDAQPLHESQTPSSAAPYEWPLPAGHRLDELTVEISLLDSTLGRQIELAVPHGYELRLDLRGLEAAMVGDRNGNYHALVDESRTYPLTYSATVQIPTYNEELLRQTKASAPNLVWGGAVDDNLQLPKGLPQRVKDLAQEITSPYTNDYDRVRAVERYLATRYAYTLRTSPPPMGSDFVDHFLFVSKKGYCVHFSTAMVVMLRSVGISSRWVTGYAPGERDNQTGQYVVRRKDAHAWVEVYFEGIGWVAFEPTPSFISHQLILSPSSHEDDDQVPDEEDDPDIGPSPLTQPAIPVSGLPDGSPDVRSPGLRWSWWWLAPVMAPVLWQRRRVVFFAQSLPRCWRLNRARQRSKRPWIEDLYHELLIICRQLRLRLPENLTPYERMEKLLALRPHWSPWLRPLTDEYMQSRFGRSPGGDDKTWQRLWTMMEMAVREEQIGRSTL